MNRYDLLCLEGLAQALRVFIGVDKVPTYKVVDMPKDHMLKMHVKPEVLTHNFHVELVVFAFSKLNINYVALQTYCVRPFIVCAVLRGVTFNEARYNSFIDLQDRLHQNICR